jgi:hypothetical protein
MKTANYGKILWCEPDNNRRRALATMHEDGTLRFGQEMCEKLHKKIRIGFLPAECAIIIEAGFERGFALRKSGEVKMADISIQLRRLGIEFPASFLFEEDTEPECWKGYIVPSVRKSNNKKPKKTIFMAEQQSILNAYKGLIDRAVYAHAKSTPADERRSIATEALLEALNGYTAAYGTLRDHLSGEIKRRLIEHNKQYIRLNQFSCISFDSPASKNNDSCETNYNWLLANLKNEIADTEAKMDMDIFRNNYLNTDEKGILRMLMSGYTVPEILAEYDMSILEIEDLCKSIGNRWHAFNNFDGNPAA